VIKNLKWLLLGGLFMIALAVAVGLGSKANVIFASQVPAQPQTPLISVANAMMPVAEDQLSKIDTTPEKSPTDLLASNQTATTKNSDVVNIDRLAMGGKYLEKVPANNSSSRKYHNIALQTGYIETYPQLDSSVMGTTNGQTVVKEALSAFNKMRAAASSDGISLKVLSGFRSIQTQVGIFERKGGGISAAQFSAPPGHSQHHTGLALDLNSLSPSFRGTAPYRWLKKNAPSYGFMLSFENSQGDLGPKNEPWHWVYVEDPRAMKLMSCFITRAKSNGYDPLLGNKKLTEIHQNATSSAICES
jgi:LAS superfamily LD-carboxypeptidase LdcB